MNVRRAITLLIVAATALGCTVKPTEHTCARYEGIALTPENDFSGVVESSELGAIDRNEERLQIVLAVARPVHGRIDLVHVVGDREIERWRLKIPRSKSPIASCNIGVGDSLSSCGALVRDRPHPTMGYYYLRLNGNVVFEAGLSFYLCERPHSM